MKKLTKKEYTTLVKEQIISTGIYAGKHISEAEDNTDFYYHLQEIQHDYKPKTITKINADAEIAKNFLKYLNDDFLLDEDSLTNYQYEDQEDITTFFRGY